MQKRLSLTFISQTKACRLRAVHWLLSFVMMMGLNSQSYAVTFELSQSSLPVCVYIGSFSSDDPWQQQIESRLRERLTNHCELRVFHLDGESSTDAATLKAKGIEAHNFIQMHSPSVVITSDDYAVLYVLVPFYRDHSLPFVFCGLNTTAKNYDLPFSNATGMVEVTTLKEMVQTILQINPSFQNLVLINTPGLSSAKDASDFHRIAHELQLTSTVLTAKTEQEWRNHYISAQQSDVYDIIVIDELKSLPTWHPQQNLELAQKYNQKLSLTTYEPSIPYAVLGMTKRATEHADWAAATAIELLNGRPIQQLEVVPNTHYDLWVNGLLIEAHTQQLPNFLLKQAQKYLPVSYSHIDSSEASEASND